MRPPAEIMTLTIPYHFAVQNLFDLPCSSRKRRIYSVTCLIRPDHDCGRHKVGMDRSGLRPSVVANLDAKARDTVSTIDVPGTDDDNSTVKQKQVFAHPTFFRAVPKSNFPVLFVYPFVQQGLFSSSARPTCAPSPLCWPPFLCCA